MFDDQGKWSCEFKGKDSVIKPVNIDHLPQDIGDTLKGVKKDEEPTPQQLLVIDRCVKQMRYGLQLVDIKTDEPYLVHALDGKHHSREEIEIYGAFHHSCHELEEAIHQKRLSGDVNHRVLIEAEYALNKARKASCDKSALTEGIPELGKRLDDITVVVNRSCSQSQESVSNLNELILMRDVHKTLDQFEQDKRYANNGGVTKMITIKNSNGLSLDQKWKGIVSEAKHRTSALSSFGGFFKSWSIFDSINTRSDEVDLFYWAIAQKDSNLRFNPNITTVEQLVIAQQKRNAIESFQDEIRRLNTPFVGSGLFGGANRVSKISPYAEAMIMTYKELIQVITDSSHKIPLSDLLVDIFDKKQDFYLVNNVTVSANLAKKHPSIYHVLSNGGINNKATSLAVVNDVRKKAFNPQSVFEDAQPSCVTHNADHELAD